MGMATHVVVLPLVMRYYRGGTRVGAGRSRLPGAIFLPLARGPGTAGDAATVEVPWLTRCDMPGQVFPPESFGPSAIAGDRLTVKTKATIAARHLKLSFRTSVA